MADFGAVQNNSAPPVTGQYPARGHESHFPDFPHGRWLSGLPPVPSLQKSLFPSALPANIESAPGEGRFLPSAFGNFPGSYDFAGKPKHFPPVPLHEPLPGKWPLFARRKEAPAC